MNMHVCVSAHKGNIVIYQMQSTGRDFVGEFLLAKFLSKYVVWVCGEVCGEELAKFYLLLFSSLKNPPKFHNKLHHAPRPQTQKNPPGGKTFSTKYIH